MGLPRGRCAEADRVGIALVLQQLVLGFGGRGLIYTHTCMQGRVVMQTCGLMRVGGTWSRAIRVRVRVRFRVRA